MKRAEIRDASVRGRHGHEEFGIGLNFFELGDQNFHGFDRGNAGHGLAERPDAREFVAVKQEFLLAGAAGLDVDGRVPALVHETAVEVER